LRFKQGCDALGMTSEPTHRNVSGCKGSGECFSGCRTGAKGSVDRNYMPAAIRAGARVFTSIRAERVVWSDDKARAIIGHVVEPFTGRVSHEAEFHADLIVLAAGCMQTPVIMQKSGLGGPWVGNDLQFHPGLALMAKYDEAIDPRFGATQGYHSLHHIREGIKLEVLWAPPAILATRLPGVGHEYQRNLLDFDRMTPFDVITAANKSRGRVRSSPFGWNPRISYDLHQDDMDLLMKGLAILADVSFASGATSVLPGIYGIPDELRSKEQAEVLRRRKFSPRDAIIGSNHAFGTTRMSRRAEDGVVDEYGRHHEVRNLYVADTGIFAGSPGVNPMLTVMALADRVAYGIKSGLC
jgi:choline dehydrogenase-like flavoprotein